MRTTVTLPPRIHERVKRLAQERGVSFSAMITELTLRGLAELDEPTEAEFSASSGLPVLSIGRRVTAEQVRELIDEAVSCDDHSTG